MTLWTDPTADPQAAAAGTPATRWTTVQLPSVKDRPHAYRYLFGYSNGSTFAGYLATEDQPITSVEHAAEIMRKSRIGNLGFISSTLIAAPAYVPPIPVAVAPGTDYNYLINFWAGRGFTTTMMAVDGQIGDQRVLDIVEGAIRSRMSLGTVNIVSLQLLTGPER